MSGRPAIGGVIVTFHPDEGFEDRLNSVAREVNSLVVVDNSAHTANDTRLHAACALYGAKLILNRANHGLAAALNQAFALLAEQRIKYAIAFDQDSMPSPNFSAALFGALSSTSRCAVVGANWQDEATPSSPAHYLRRRRFLPLMFRWTIAEHDLTDVTCVIASGSLFDLSVWEAIGRFDETLFLDLVDTEYCLRALVQGYVIAVAARARLAHRRGAKRSFCFLGRTWTPAFMPESRLYYLFRNRILLLVRYWWRLPHWACFELVYAAKVTAEICCLEPRKRAKLAACIGGTWDGLRGRSGKRRIRG